MHKLFLILISAWLILPFKTATAVEDDGVRAVYATACENLHPDESKASARTRAADKASFKALENLSDLSDYRDSYDTHDYNVLIYALIDNYLEDMAIRTIKRDDQQICVELTGYLNRNNIANAIADIAAKQEALYPDQLVVEKSALTEPSPSGLPPKPTLKISDDIAVETALAEEKTPEQAVIVSADAGQNDSRTKVFIERTKFYNNTSTNAFYADMAQVLGENALLNITNSLGDADYVIKTKVLRAKVDPINKQTSRLQMVVALELINTKDSSVLTEHQNRFILFESTEDEQTVAASLLKKLLRKAARQIAPKIKIKNDDNLAKSVITPPKN